MPERKTHHENYVCAFQDHRLCYSDCHFTHTEGNVTLTFDFSLLGSAGSLMNGPKFTSKGTKYFHMFNISLCGGQVCIENNTNTEQRRTLQLKAFIHRWNSSAFFSPFKDRMAVCRDNVSDVSISSSQSEKAEGSSAVKTFICQSTIIPASRQGFSSALSSQSINLADTFLGKWTLDHLPRIIRITPFAVLSLLQPCFCFENLQKGNKNWSYRMCIMSVFLSYTCLSIKDPAWITGNRDTQDKQPHSHTPITKGNVGGYINLTVMF